VQDEILANIGIAIWLYGWAIIWPLSRWGLRRSQRECRVLFWIFVIAIGLEAASFIYLWSLYHSGNRDWFMAWMFPQAVATIAWFASLLTLLNVALTPTHKASSTHEPGSPVT